MVDNISPFREITIKKRFSVSTKVELLTDICKMESLIAVSLLVTGCNNFPTLG